MHDHSEHNHAHSHHHHHEVTAADVANGTFVAGIIMNGVYVVAEVVAGIMTNSMALLSDAGHNLGDVAALSLSLLSFRLAKAKPTHTFTYGYKKSTILAALANAVILLVSIGVMGYASVNRFMHPEPIQGGVVAWVAAIGIIINTISAMLFFRNKDHELNSKAAYMHLFMDAIVSLCVVIAGIVIHYTEYNWLDPAISLVVLVLILYNTWSLLTNSLRLTMDAVPESIDYEDVKSMMTKVPGVQDIHHTHIWAMSTTENALTTHLVLDSALSFDNKMKLVQQIKDDLFHKNIQHATIELESEEVPCVDPNC